MKSPNGLWVWVALGLLMPLHAEAHAQEKRAVVRLTSELTTAELGEPELAKSPDGKWLAAFYKVSSGVRVAVLYKHQAGELASATIQGQRLDEAAWRWWARQKRGRRVPSLDEGPRLANFIGWQQKGRFLDLSLVRPKMRPLTVRLDLQTGSFSRR